MEDESTVQSTGDVGDMLGIGEPSGDEQAATPSEAPSDPIQAETQSQEPVTDPPVAYGQTEVQPPAPTPTFRIGDKDYTAAEIEAWKTSAQQLPHLQKKYVEALEQKNQPQAGPQPTQQPQQTPQAYMQALRQKYDPVVKQYADSGILSQDYVTLFPAEAAQMVHYAQRHEQLENVVRAIASDMQGRSQKEQQTGLVNQVAQSMNALASSGEPFAPLKDPVRQQEFWNYLWEMNPQVVQLSNPDFLARQWVAFNKDQYLQTAQTRQIQAQRSQQARLARADATGGTRAPGVMSEPAKSPLDEMFEDHLERSR